MIGTGEASQGNDLSSKRPEAALHPVPDNRATNLLRDREADAHRSVAIVAVAHEQDEAGCCRALPAVCGQEIRALLDGS